MNPQTISDVLREFERNSKQKNDIYKHRSLEVSEKFPEISKIDKEISILMVNVSKAVFKKSPAMEIDQIRQSVETLRQKKMNTLAKNGLPANYLTQVFECKKCNDTGYNRDKYCDCLFEKCKIYENRNRGLHKTNLQSFETFDLNYYSKQENQNFGMSPYENSSLNLRELTTYANTFSSSSDNIILSGANGLSKTHLANSIATVISEKGFSTIVTPSVDMFEIYEANKFQGNDESRSSKIHAFENCDFLVIDGLGFDMTSNFTKMILYKLINYRVEHQKPILITTTFSMSKLEEKYTDMIASRLKGDFETYFFFGDDIRSLIRRNRR